MIYGLTAAIAWGTSAVFATYAARRSGAFLTVLIGQVLGLVLLLTLTAVLRPSFSAVHGSVAVGLVACGVIGLLGYLTFYRALEEGPVGLVSAIGATYGGVTAVLAVLFLGESLGTTGAWGVALAVGGVTMAASRSSGGRVPAIAADEPLVGIAVVPQGTTRYSSAGISFALASALAYGVGGFLLGDFSGRAGWLTATVVARLASMVVLLAVLPFLGRRPSTWRGAGAGFWWALTAGATDVVGICAFARGGQVGQLAVTAAVSSVYPVIPVVAGMLLFGERLGPRQAIGVALIVVGLVLLGLVS
ncbi:MAG TPA: DMT family transporter [Actinomycetota bacterium]|nr:DMT family transporter [Actinomycetota bacterium]